MAAERIRVAVLTISDGVASGEREDRGGPACEEALRASRIPHDVVLREALPDEPSGIAARLGELADHGEADLVVLTGGTGVAPRDRTPEAVRSVADLEVPGLAEKMRAETGRSFPAAYLSRQVVAVRRRTILLALPGSPQGAADCLRAVADLLPHAIALVRGGRPAHPRPPGDND